MDRYTHSHSLADLCIYCHKNVNASASAHLDQRLYRADLFLDHRKQ